jgi:hypothetical protein
VSPSTRKQVHTYEEIREVIKALEILDLDYRLTRTRMTEAAFNELVGIEIPGDADKEKGVWRIQIWL